MRSSNTPPNGRDGEPVARPSDGPATSIGLRRTSCALALLACLGCGDDGSPGMVATGAPTTSASIDAGPVAPVVVDAFEGPTTMPADWDAEPEPSPRADVDLTQYVPNDALAYVEFRSLDALEEALLRFSAVAELTGQSWSPVDALLPITSAGVDPSRVDRTAPIGIALAPVPGEFVPGLVLMVPALTDAPVVHSVAALQSRRMGVKRVDDGYAIVQHDQMSDDVPRGEAAVAQDLPEGFVRGRVSVGAIRPLVAPYVRQTTDHLNEQYRLARPRVSDSQLKKLDANAFLQGLEIADQIGFGLDLIQDQVDVELRLVDCKRVIERRERGKLGVEVDADTVQDLARHVELDDALSLVFAFDRDTMIEDFQEGWNEAQLEDVVKRGAKSSKSDDEFGDGGDALDTIARSVARMLASFEPAAAVSMSLEPAKAHVAVYLATKDVERAREAISLLLSKCDLETWGFEMALPIRSRIDGTMVEDYSVRFDTRRIGFDRRAAMREAFKTFLGDSTLHVKVATSEHHVLLVFGGDTTAVNRRIRSFDSQTTAHPTMTKAVGRSTRGEAATVVHTDFVQLISQIAGLGAVMTGQSVSYAHREIVREVGTDSAQFTFWTAIDGDDELLGATFDLNELARAFDAFKGSGL
ncbi:MAG: hypothetical protein AAGI22_05090 [Planctomycetota bacterium]